jgi:carbamoyl-phosphate synthase small subunit
VVSARQPYDWTQTEWSLGGPGYGTQAAPRFHVVAYDFGVKKNILRMLAQRGCKVTVVPAQTPPLRCWHQPDGIFLSNGPGDPEPCDYAIAAARELIETGIPTFGICLGHQIMALASWREDLQDEVRPPWRQPPGQGPRHRARQHHQPEPRLRGGRKNLPANLRATHISLFDNTLQGLARTDKPAFCFQGHPEASPGPHDISYLFDRFTR